MVNISDNFYKLLSKLVNDHNNDKKGRRKCGKKSTVEVEYYCKSYNESFNNMMPMEFTK